MSKTEERTRDLQSQTIKRVISRLLTLVFLIGIGVGTGYWWKYTHGYPRCKTCNVIVISLDQVRAKSLPCFGYRENTAPNLCAFAAKSHVYTNAFTTASRTHDAHFSMITGLYPSTHTMTLPYSSTLPPDIPTFAELMKKQGYQTYFFGPVGDPHLPLTRGMERGFDRTFDADDPKKWVESMEKISTTPGTGNTPKFYFMHTYEAHEPYMPNPEDLKLFYDGPEQKQMTYKELCTYTYTKLITIRPELTLSLSAGGEDDDCKKIEATQDKKIKSYSDFNDMYSVFNDSYWHQFEDMSKSEKARFTHALYIAQIHMLDSNLGVFFQYLQKTKLLDNTIVIIVGDQGDEFFEHDSYSHGWSLYDEVLHVPFIVYVPDSGSSVSHRLVSVVDILPTVFHVLQKKLMPVVAGYSVFAEMTHHMIIAEHVSDGALKLQTDQYTLIRRVKGGAFEIELFDRKTDPGETHNIFKNHIDVVKSLLQEYARLQDGFPKYTGIQNPLPTWLKKEDRENLIQSGYF